MYMCVLNDHVCAIDLLLNFSRDNVCEEKLLTLDNWVEFDIIDVVVLIVLCRIDIGSLGNPCKWGGLGGAREARGECYSTCDVGFKSH